MKQNSAAAASLIVLQAAMKSSQVLIAAGSTAAFSRISVLYDICAPPEYHGLANSWPSAVYRPSTACSQSARSAAGMISSIGSNQPPDEYSTALADGTKMMSYPPPPLASVVTVLSWISAQPTKSACTLMPVAGSNSAANLATLPPSSGRIKARIVTGAGASVGGGASGGAGAS